MPRERCRISRAEISGFKSIKHAAIELRNLNVLIGANGSGKSNLLSYFELLKESLNGRLESYVGRHGGANALLHLGAKQTQNISSALNVSTRNGQARLFQKLSYKAPDSLFIDPDDNSVSPNSHWPSITNFDGHCAIAGDDLVQEKLHFGLQVVPSVYHFHDTSLLANIRQSGYIGDDQSLQNDGKNLAAFLYSFKDSTNKARYPFYERIVRTIRKVAPSFDNFELSPHISDSTRILLNWRQKNSDHVFGPHQLSDGTLRAMALITLLLQPEENLPDVILIDEPELGLHPHALEIIAGLIGAAGLCTQVIVATQSPSFVDCFDPEDIIVTEWMDGCTEFRRLDAEDLTDWLEDYSIGELWEKNVGGGGPLR